MKFSKFLLFLGIVSALQASSFKKYAGEFLYLGVGGRATAMGGSFSALANDVTASYWNPAGLMSAEGFQVNFTHVKQFIGSIQNNYIAFSHPFKDNSRIAFSVYYLTVNDILDSRSALIVRSDGQTGIDYSKIKKFNTGDYVFTLSYAQNYYENLDIGVNVKLLYRDFEIENAFGLGFDAGAKYHIDDLTLGLMLRDITSTMIAWSTDEKQFVTPSARLGAAYSFYFSDFNLAFTPTAELSFIAENREFSAQYNLGPLSLDLLAGGEVVYNDILALRFGMDDIQRFNAGIGLIIPKVSIDYSFTEYASELGNIHRISLHLRLNELY